MLKRIGLLTAVWVLCVSWAGAAQAQCIVDTSTPTYANGEFLRYHPCDANGNVKVTGGGGGGGAATIADGADTALGATTDAACVAGAAGTVSCKLRQMSADIDAIKTAVQTIDDAIESTRLRTTLYDSSGNEIVVPTAGLTHNIVSAASTNATNVNANDATLYHISLRNTTTTAYSLRLYNLATTPTCSSSTGYVTTVVVPPASASGQVGGSETPLNIGMAFTTGLAYCITGGPTSTDNTNAAVGVYGFLLYKP